MSKVFGCPPRGGRNLRKRIRQQERGGGGKIITLEAKNAVGRGDISVTHKTERGLVWIEGGRKLKGKGDTPKVHYPMGNKNEKTKNAPVSPRPHNRVDAVLFRKRQPRRGKKKRHHPRGRI